MNENTISYALDSIKNATDRMRTKTGTIGQPIENVATAVENIDDITNYFNPTAENMAKWICDQIIPCYKVTVQESEGNIATYEEDED